MTTTLRNFADVVTGVILFPFVIVTLLWFIYAVFLKKPLRARHIRILRERRELREAALRSRNSG
ncbi:MAG TPA: hypothetical protein VN622_13550 [Clostridia bacterium]|nr:hypothetical protein [Clostridia bacterium]